MPFDYKTKCMITIIKLNNKFRVFVKGK
ncbi:MAG: hypothetical protein ACK52J_05295 [bacterium]